MSRRDEAEPGFLLEALCTDAGDQRWAHFCAAFTAWALAAGAAPDLARTRGLAPAQTALDVRCVRARFLAPDLDRFAGVSRRSELGDSGNSGTAALQREPCEGWPMTPGGGACAAHGAAPQGGVYLPAHEPSVQEPCEGLPRHTNHGVPQGSCNADREPGGEQAGPGDQGSLQLREPSRPQQGAAAQHSPDHTLPSGPLTYNGVDVAAWAAAASLV